MKEYIVIQLSLGLIAPSLFRYRNPHRACIDIVSIFLCALFVGNALLAVTDTTLALVVWVASAVGLALAYLVRFSRKHEIDFFDYIKLASIVALILYSIPYHFVAEEVAVFKYYMTELTLPATAIVYIYDRLILNTEMKKRFIVILSIQSIMILMLLIFSTYQRAMAEAALDAAVDAQNKAIEMRIKYQELLDARSVPK